MKVFIRKLIRPFIAIVCVLMLTRLASAAPDTASIRAQIVGMPLGTRIELFLKDKQKLRGARGAVVRLRFYACGCALRRTSNRLRRHSLGKAGQHKVTYRAQQTDRRGNWGRRSSDRDRRIGPQRRIFMSFRQSKCEAWGRAGSIPSGTMRATEPGLGADSPTLESRLPTLPA